MSPEHDLLTIAEAAVYLGKSPGTLKNWARKRWIQRANPPTDGKTTRSLYRRADLDAIGDPQAAYQARRAARREQVRATGMRLCLGPCGRTLPLAEFRDVTRGLLGKSARCVSCLRTFDRDYKREHRSEYTAIPRAWWQRTKATRYAVRNAWKRRVMAEKGNPSRERILARNRQWNDRDGRLRRALAWGKSSPVCRRTGFSIALDVRTQQMRAARLDLPLPTGETALVQYGYVSGRWVVLPPPVRAHSLCGWVYARCRRLESTSRRKVREGAAV